MNKPDCYKCVHRQNIPGDAHSRCGHPSNDTPLLNHPLMQVISMLGHGAPMPELPTTLKVVGDERGRARGWFNWPLNYDPTWLMECDGFEAMP